MNKIFWVVVLIAFPLIGLSAESPIALNLMHHPLSKIALIIFILSYLAVMSEEKIQLNKSKPVLLGAGLIWILVAFIAQSKGIDPDILKVHVEHMLNEYAAIFLFLLVAMTYINVLSERDVFNALKVWLVRKKFTLHQLFWITGILAFFTSPIADNMTTALLMGAVLMSIGQGHPKFIALSMINVVVAANAGGAFCPFGDITTLMVWQAEKAEFFDFFQLLLPALVNFIVPASIMAFWIPKATPTVAVETIRIKPGGKTAILLFLVTIALAVLFEQFLHLPPFLGMVTGFSLLMFLIYSLKLSSNRSSDTSENVLDIFETVALAEWDTLFFFLGVIFSVSGLAALGYLHWLSDTLYGNLGMSWGNILSGLISSVVDNIPVMFAILNMNLDMDLFQWLLITLTAGVGGSLLSIGSAAGVALMGVSKGTYSFLGHLRWSWAILLGYALSIVCHFVLNQP